MQGAGSDQVSQETRESPEYPPEVLHGWVGAAHQQCGFSDSSSANIVEMMAGIEARLNECLVAAASLPPGFVEEWEKSREKERRQVSALNLHDLDFDFDSKS